MNIIDINNEIIRLENDNKIIDGQVSSWTNSRNEYQLSLAKCRPGSRGEQCRVTNSDSVSSLTKLIYDATEKKKANNLSISTLTERREDALKTAEEIKKSQGVSRAAVAAALAQQGKTEASVLQEAQADAEAKIMAAKVQADALNETLSIENSNKRRNAMLVAAAILLVLVVTFIIVYKKYIKKK